MSDYTIEDWRRDAVHIDGWEPKIFTIREINNPGATVFGWTRESFGVDCQNVETQFGMFQLAALTHLGTGMRVFFFDAAESAALAGRLAERAGDWTKVSPEGLNGAIDVRQMYRLWENAGLVYFSGINVEGRGIWARNQAAGAAGRA